MTSRTFLLAATATVAMACAVALAPIVVSAPAAAQANPTMTNVIPEGGNFAVKGNVQAIDPGARTLTIVPSSGSPLPMAAGPGVSLDNLSTGDTVSAHYTRTVTFVVGTPNVATPPAEDTKAVGQVAQTPGGIGPEAAVITGTVVKLNSASSFDVVNANGGGIYTIQVTDPARLAIVKMLKVGDSVTVSIGPLVLTSVAKCGVFGLFC